MSVASASATDLAARARQEAAKAMHSFKMNPKKRVSKTDHRVI